MLSAYARARILAPKRIADLGPSRKPRFRRGCNVVRMRNKRIFFPSWILTRVLFSVGAMTLFSSIPRLVAGAGDGWWVGLAGGATLLALATRGPWDAAGSGRNRSVMGFRVRKQPRDGEAR